MKGERLVQVGMETWSFRIGRELAVIVSPGGYKSRVSLSTITGRPGDMLERGQWKGTSDGMVTPTHVREYIIGHRSALLPASGAS